MGAVCRAAQPRGHHGPGHQRHDAAGAQRPPDAGRPAVRQLAGLLRGRRPVRRLMARAAKPGADAAHPPSRHPAGRQHAVPARAPRCAGGAGLPGVRRPGRGHTLHWRVGPPA
ncbi:conserved hypothetical protein [Ricinus communis]|uniref:Uncharacterized protein n=1 Tax=Ricinus communis TaxID=3988 RepID=B9TAE2_RICCO|nr:conserved hypothetical protein [Ricinus communis]